VANDPSNAGDEFLLREYEHFADSFWRTEELGEKRVNFYISLVTAVVVALVALAKDKGRFSAHEVEGLAVGAGCALMLVGTFTFLRMMRRNAVSDQYKHAMGLIRAHFQRRGDLGDYQPFERLPRMLWTGGLAQTVALLNSLIAGAVAAVALLLVARASFAALPAIVVFAVAFSAHFWVLHRRYKKG
jgi:hypothetical protein